MDPHLSVPWKAYLNTAGSGLQTPQTRKAVRSYLELEEVVGSYFSERAYGDLLDGDLYQAAAALFHCRADDVSMFDSATRAWHTIISAFPLGPRDVVWTTPYEWAGNLFHLRRLQRSAGFRLQEIPFGSDGGIDLDWCHQNISDDVALISITHIPSCSGAVTPLAPLSSLVRGRRSMLAVDACQSAGLVPIRLTETPVDLLTVTGKKALLGPRGTGMAIVSERFRTAAEPVSIDVHTHEFARDGRIEPTASGARRFELGEKCVSSFVGLTNALHEAAQNDWLGIEARSAHLLNRVREIPGITVHTSQERIVGIVSVSHRALPAEQLWQRLCEAGIGCWLIQGAHTPNYLLRQDLRQAVRLSVGPRTTIAEIDCAADALADISRRASFRELAPSSPQRTNTTSERI